MNLECGRRAATSLRGVKGASAVPRGGIVGRYGADAISSGARVCGRVNVPTKAAISHVSSPLQLDLGGNARTRPAEESERIAGKEMNCGMRTCDVGRSV